MHYFKVLRSHLAALVLLLAGCSSYQLAPVSSVPASDAHELAGACVGQVGRLDSRECRR